jgi:transposase-like protein
MRQKSVPAESPSERLVKNIRRATRKRHSAEEKLRIVLDGLRGESSMAELCRREGIGQQFAGHAEADAVALRVSALRLMSNRNLGKENDRSRQC